MGNLKSPCTVVNSLVFEKIAFLYFGDRRTNRQTNRWTGPLHEAALAVASGGSINKLSCYLSMIYACFFSLSHAGSDVIVALLERDICTGVSVCLSVTRSQCVKTSDRRIMQFSTTSSPRTLYFFRLTFIP